MTTDFGYTFFDVLMYGGSAIMILGVTLFFIAIGLMVMSKLAYLITSPFRADADSE